MGRHHRQQLGSVRWGNPRAELSGGISVTEYSFWKLQLWSGLAFSACVFAAAFWTSRRRSNLPPVESWAAVAISATVGGVLLGLAAEKWLYESFGLFSWVMQSLLLAAAIAAPLLSAME